MTINRTYLQRQMGEDGTPGAFGTWDDNGFNPWQGDPSQIQSQMVDTGGDSGGQSAQYYVDQDNGQPDLRIQHYPGMFPAIERALASGQGMNDQQRQWLRQYAGGSNDQDLWNNAVRQYQHSQDQGGWGNLFKNPATLFAAATGGLGGMTGANLATGGNVGQGVQMDLAGLAAGAGAAGLMATPEVGAGTLLADAGTVTDAPIAWDTTAGTSLGSGLNAGAGTADVMGTGGYLSGGAYSSAGGSGLMFGGNAANGLAVSPGVSSAAGWGGVTGTAGSAAADSWGLGSIGSFLGNNWAPILGSGLQLYQMNTMSNAMRGLQEANKFSSLDQPQRAPYQQNLSNLVNNPQDYLNKDPYATSLASLYKNQIIPRDMAKSGNPAEVLDRQGSQFVNQISQNYNQQVGNLSGIAGFGFPQSNMAGYLNANLGTAAANMSASAVPFSLANAFAARNMGQTSGQSGTGLFGKYA